ncbi:uncharacterized protein BO95DRAFT_160135 [Aspergillus brunneoviolaceus CBS 621.78]|uniref:Uncharacterized protein n=1 Tax=Aspergillus brunneoviolaceus CBS 621.78 TaxID=1450534 RepID=A0ACD1GN00_9EURO|nr:hypothetical protein BO95DRAFT_160135 [Aspergillus brunneoviolaceus CBS 621.78]RAH50715.1 hypothetical protein BO95DRAFT_160135 [Aspergillus brunneoviolaceus CBS 621.78]
MCLSAPSTLLSSAHLRCSAAGCPTDSPAFPDFSPSTVSTVSRYHSTLAGTQAVSSTRSPDFTAGEVTWLRVQGPS